MAGDVDDDERDVRPSRRRCRSSRPRRRLRRRGASPRRSTRRALADIGLELRAQGEHDRRALLDRLTGSLGIDQLLPDPAPHGVDVERERRELGRTVRLDRRVERAGPDPAHLAREASIGRVTQRRIRYAATNAPTTAMSPIPTNNQVSCARYRSRCSAAACSSACSRVLSAPKPTRTWSKRALPAPEVTAAAVASAPPGASRKAICGLGRSGPPIVARPHRRAEQRPQTCGIELFGPVAIRQAATCRRPLVYGSRNVRLTRQRIPPLARSPGPCRRPRAERPAPARPRAPVRAPGRRPARRIRLPRHHRGRARRRRWRRRAAAAAA